MDDIQVQVIKCISEEIKRQNSFAYFDSVCYKVFGELNEENETKLKGILDELIEKNRITLNGDRIGLKKSDFLIVDMYENEVERLNKVGLKCKGRECDIGHGCNIPGLGIELDINFIASIIIGVGLHLNDIKGAVEGYKYVKDKIKEVFFNNEKEYYGEVYYGEDILKLRVLERIIAEYKDKKISQIKLINQSKVKVGASGMFSVQNYGFSEESLEGSPQFIGYFVFEVWLDDLDYDYDLVRCEILSNSNIISFNKTPIDVSYGISAL